MFRTQQDIERYEGPRTAAAIVEYLKDKVGLAQDVFVDEAVPIGKRFPEVCVSFPREKKRKETREWTTFAQPPQNHKRLIIDPAVVLLTDDNFEETTSEGDW